VYVRVLDDHDEPAPDGAAGELAIGGVGVTRGYVGRPDLTAERFVPDPLGAAGTRLYRSGDRARRRPDGELEYLGRIDDQVKLRGFRVEPREVEAVLLRHPAVREAAVVARAVHGEIALVAYVCGAGLDAGALRAFLSDALPSFMLPSVFVVADRLPLTSNGKVDRNALPPPALEHSAPPVAPSTPIEEALADALRELLGLDRVGTEDDFFLIGGHSLLAARILARVGQTLDLDISSAVLFSAEPTITAFARQIAHAIAAKATAAEFDRAFSYVSSLSEEEATRRLAAHARRT
jgi:hypothetical protein